MWIVWKKCFLMTISGNIPEYCINFYATHLRLCESTSLPRKAENNLFVDVSSVLWKLHSIMMHELQSTVNGFDLAQQQQRSSSFQTNISFTKQAIM